MPSQRYKITISYKGTRYHGWQAQPPTEPLTGEGPPGGRDVPTVQMYLTRAIEWVVGHPVSCVGSSRTDSGVHAKGQIAHFDTSKIQIPPESLRRAVNHQLPGDILIRSIEPMPPDFDAIFWTTRKRYQYFIWNAPDRPPFFHELAWHRWQKLDIAAMAAAAAHLVGEHDFASFARPGHGRIHTVRTIFNCEVHYRSPRLLIGVEGSGFLWNMVRIIVGTLVQVGVGRFSPDDIPVMLKARDRAAGGPTAPPTGLFLQWVKTRRPEPGDADKNASRQILTPVENPGIAE